MGIDDAVKLGFSNYVNFEGRACRSEYWYWCLFAFIGLIATSIIDQMIGVPITGGMFGLAVFFPGLSVTVRRLHDLDFSGWWILVPLIPLVAGILPTLIPLVGEKLAVFIPLLQIINFIIFAIASLGIVMFIIFMCSQGTDGPNRFGADRLAGLEQTRPRSA